MRSLSLLTAAVSVGLLCNCATIISGTSQMVRIDSDPQGATILVDGLSMGKTPATIALQRPGFSNKTVTLRQDGYADSTFLLQKSFNGVSVLNLLLTLWPFAIDLATGAFMSYDPAGYTIELKKKRVEISDQLGVEKVVFAHELAKDEQGNLIVPAADENKKVAVVDVEKQQVVVFNY